MEEGDTIPPCVYNSRSPRNEFASIRTFLIPFTGRNSERKQTDENPISGKKVSVRLNYSGPLSRYEDEGRRVWHFFPFFFLFPREKNLKFGIFRAPKVNWIFLHSEEARFPRGWIWWWLSCWPINRIEFSRNRATACIPCSRNPYIRKIAQVRSKMVVARISRRRMAAVWKRKKKNCVPRVYLFASKTRRLSLQALPFFFSLSLLTSSLRFSSATPLYVYKAMRLLT